MIRRAADLALLGFLLTLAALPVVTAGAAVSTAACALRHHLTDDSWPSWRTLLTTFRGTFLPGLPTTLATLAAAAAVVADWRAVHAGIVPGGPFLLAALALAAAAGAGWAALRLSGLPVGPRSLPAASGVLLVATLLALLVHPVLIPPLLGYTLFALHVVTARLTPATP